ncbi:hypothetical protein LTR53_016724, partial [Teratosphaeriaceae sp. CCFEE 6253]
MAGGAKKKKTKPVANPLRGFATVSVPKASVDVKDDINSKTASGAATPDTAPTSVASEDGRKPELSGAGQRELHELNPEELEAELETSDLQQFVEQHAARVRKDAARSSSRLEIDKRVLRGQADFLSVKSWLPEELMQQLLDLTMAEEAAEQTQAPSRGPLSPDDLLSKVWTLRLCLLDLEVPRKDVDVVLSELVANPPRSEGPGSIWGLGDALDWLSRHMDSSDLRDYDDAKPSTIPAAVASHDELPRSTDLNNTDQSKREQRRQTNASAQSTDDRLVPAIADFDVSDVESDIEPDELMSVYLRTKARLFEVNSMLVEDVHSKKKRTAKKERAALPSTKSNGERKLQQKLQKIEADVLFDQREADYQWNDKRLDLAREAADRRKLQLPQELTSESTGASQTGSSRPSASAISDEAERLGQEVLLQNEDEEESDILGGMFGALPDVEQSAIGPVADGTPPQPDIKIRDFGRWTGMSPKRIVEEACKARDSSAKLQFTLISPTTYSSRHSLTIRWSKDQDMVEGAYLHDFEVRSRPRMLVISTFGQATPDVMQSEALVATAALFLIFASSPKEEKAHMKLPPTFRDVWNEMLGAKAEHADASDRATVKELRNLVEQAFKHDVDDEEDDEVVFKA